MADPNETKHVDGVEARGGESPGIVRYILIISLVLIVVIFAFLIWGNGVISR